MTVSTFTQPSYPDQLGTTYPTNIDSCVNVLAQIGQDFAPHAASSPNLTVLIDAGKIIKADGTLVEQAQQTATFVAPAANPRIDRIVVDMLTGAYSIIAGTEAASPTAPAITAGNLPCAQVSLIVGQTQITNANITDERTSFANYDARYLPSQAPEYAVASGTDTYTATLSPVPAAYVTGARYHVRFTNANTVAAPTLDANGLGAKTIKKEGGAALVAGDIPAGHEAVLTYNGTDLILGNPVTVSSANRPLKGVFAYRAAAQSIANATTAVAALDTEAYDTDDFHDNVTNNSRLTIPAGVSYVRVSGGGSWAQNSTGDRRISLSKTNGTALPVTIGFHSPATARAGVTTSQSFVSPVLAVAAGDYFELQCDQNSGGALDLVYAYLSLEVIK